MATVYSYIRFSSKPQEQGDSLRRQRALGNAWMDRHPEHALDTSLRLRDLGVSAFKGANLDEHKGDLGKFVALAKQGQIPKGSILMLESLDRFSRMPTRNAYRVFCELVEAGVRVLVLDPEKIIDECNIDNMDVVIVVIIKMQLGFEESRQKSARLTQAWHGKRAKVNERKLTGNCPGWLRLVEDGKRFELIPENVESVRTIFRLANSGMGSYSISKRLQQDGVPWFGRARKGKAPRWSVSRIKKLLRDRAVLGEFQPHSTVDGKRVKVGDVILNYFPPIIKEQEFFSAMRSRGERRMKGGQHGRSLTNLFTGLLKDARDASNMVVVDKGSGPMLVSVKAREGVPGTTYLSFPYETFERTLLIWGWDLPLGDVLPRQPDDLEKERRDAEGKVAALEYKIDTTKTKMRNTTEIYETWLDMLSEAETELRQARRRVEGLKAAATTSVSETLDQTKELIERLRHAPDQEVYDLRLKLRAALRRLVSDIVVLVFQLNGDRVAVADIKLVNGTLRRVISSSGKVVNLPEGLDELDVRKWNDWPECYRKSRFTVITNQVQQMMEWEDAGYTRTEIACKLGMSKSQVSRALLVHGRRKQERKSADAERLMSWHGSGNGWAKQHKGKRYFIGLERLRKLYPKLVTDQAEGGSWKAANEWWRRKLSEFGQ